MAVEFVMPKLAMAMQQGTVSQWLVTEGEKVLQGQVILIIETEKVSYDCEAPADGLVHILVEAGTTVPVYEKLALIVENAAELNDLKQRLDASESTGSKAYMPPSIALLQPAAPENDAAPHMKKKVNISPLALKLAYRHHLNVDDIVGSGPGGRILKEDVEKALSGSGTASIPAVPSETLVEIIEGKTVKQSIPVKGMRKAIADHMVSSLASSAQLSATGEIDMSQMVRLRTVLLEKEEEIGVRISYSDLIVRALVKAVKDVPLVNSSLINGEIKIWEDINVSIAVAVEGKNGAGGLVAPVLKQCNTMSLVDISRSLKELSARARNGALAPNDLEGGTITVSNVSIFGLGWTVSTPILNKPQAMLIQPGAIFEKPVAENGHIEIRPMMTVSITFDHRILDGGPAGRFFGRLKELCEKPDYLHL